MSKGRWENNAGGIKVRVICIEPELIRKPIFLQLNQFMAGHNVAT